jgi:hypothetical protein
MRPAVDNGGRPDRKRHRTARQAFELRTINEYGLTRCFGHDRVVGSQDRRSPRKGQGHKISTAPALTQLATGLLPTRATSPWRPSRGPLLDRRATSTNKISWISVVDLTSRTPQELAAEQLFEPLDLAIVRPKKEPPHLCRHPDRVVVSPLTEIRLFTQDGLAIAAIDTLRQGEHVKSQ